MLKLDCYKYGNPLYHTQKNEEGDFFALKAKKIYKIKIRHKLIYHIELYYYENFVFIKFYPKIYEGDQDRFKKVGMNLTFKERRMLLNTCCDITHREMQCDSSYIYCFIAQIYDKDNEKKRLKSKRFDLYIKQVSTFFRSDEYLRYKSELFNFYCLCSEMEKEPFISKLQALINHIVSDQELVNHFITDEQKRLLLKEALASVN